MCVCVYSLHSLMCKFVYFHVFAGDSIIKILFVSLHLCIFSSVSVWVN